MAQYSFSGASTQFMTNSFFLYNKSKKKETELLT
jgi:hypothetical protein